MEDLPQVGEGTGLPPGITYDTNTELYTYKGQVFKDMLIDGNVFSLRDGPSGIGKDLTIDPDTGTIIKDVTISLPTLRPPRGSKTDMTWFATPSMAAFHEIFQEKMAENQMKLSYWIGELEQKLMKFEEALSKGKFDHRMAAAVKKAVREAISAGIQVAGAIGSFTVAKVYQGANPATLQAYDHVVQALSGSLQSLTKACTEVGIAWEEGMAERLDVALKTTQRILQQIMQDLEAFGQAFDKITQTPVDIAKISTEISKFA